MNKKDLILFLILLVAVAIVVVFIYKLALWYEQTLGKVLSYIIMLAVVSFIFAPFKFIKDGQKEVTFTNYIKYFGYTILRLCKFVINALSQALSTVIFIISSFFRRKNK